MKKLPVAMVFLICLIGTRANLAEMTVYTRQHDVLADAIRHGNTSGIMQGEVAEHFSRQFRSTGPLLVTAKVIQSVASDWKWSSGCGDAERAH